MVINNLKGLSDLAKAVEDRKTKEVLTVGVGDVVSKIQVRKRFRKIEELAATLLSEGQQSSIIVLPKNTNGKYIIQNGERRWRACKHAKIKTIDVIINHKAQNDLDETASELIENIQRDDLAPVEIAEGLNKFVKNNWKQKDIADRLGKNITYVSMHLSLLKMPDCVRKLYDNELCADTETLNNLRLLFDLNAERCRTVCTVALLDGITRKQSRELLNDAKRIKEAMTKNTQADPCKKTIAENVDSLLPLIKDKEWKHVHPENMVFTVNITSNGQSMRGVIMTDRISLDPKNVWIKVLDRDGKEKYVHVPVSNIELLSVAG